MAGEVSNRMDSKVFLFTGPEGSGKSTHARKFATSQGLTLVSFGDLVRNKIKHDQTAIGDACREAQSRGGYVVFDAMRQIITERLQDETYRVDLWLKAL